MITRSGRQADVGALRQGAGHADLRAALAQDGKLRPAVHTAAGQRRVPLLLQVHSKVSVHRPAAPFPLDLGLHLQGETSQRHFYMYFRSRLIFLATSIVHPSIHSFVFNSVDPIRVWDSFHESQHILTSICFSQRT